MPQTKNNLTSLIHDPYSHLDEHQTSRIVARASIDDFRLINGVRPKRGNIQDTVGILFYTLAQKCRQLNLNTYTDYDRYVKFLTVTLVRINAITPFDIDIADKVAESLHDGRGTPTPLPTKEVESGENGRGVEAGRPKMAERHGQHANPKTDVVGGGGHIGRGNNKSGRKGKTTSSPENK